MSAIKEHYHEEICRMSEQLDDIEYLEQLQAEDEEFERGFRQLQEDIA